MTYIWSDCHFWHKNIIDYEKRPFSSVEEMNETLINNWNSVVKKDDTIINLGDFAFCGKEKAIDILNKTNGYKILIMGNHDKGRNHIWWMDVGFNEVYKYPIIYDKFYILSHEPMYMMKDMPYVNCHGHTHSESSDNSLKVNLKFYGIL